MLPVVGGAVGGAVVSPLATLRRLNIFCCFLPFTVLMLHGLGGLSEETDRLEGGLEHCLSLVEPSFPPSSR